MVTVADYEVDDKGTYYVMGDETSAVVMATKAKGTASNSGFLSF